MGVAEWVASSRSLVSARSGVSRTIWLDVIVWTVIKADVVDDALFVVKPKCFHLQRLDVVK